MLKIFGLIVTNFTKIDCVIIFAQTTNSAAITLGKVWVVVIVLRSSSAFCSGVTFSPHFLVHVRGMHNWNTHLCTPRGCAVPHLACTVQLRGNTGMGHVFTFAREG